MNNPVIIDNDVIVKISCYALGDELLDYSTFKGIPPIILAVAPYVVRSRIKKSKSIADREAAGCRFEALLSHLQIAEPTSAELDLAASFETKAQELNLELDSGESQILALLIIRGLPLMVTGDKRAIQAIGPVAGAHLDGPRVACLEQVIVTIVQRSNFADIRTRICREPTADRAISICFACASTILSDTSVLEGLTSYINDVRTRAPRLLLPTDDLSHLIP